MINIATLSEHTKNRNEMKKPIEIDLSARAVDYKITELEAKTEWHSSLAMKQEKIISVKMKGGTRTIDIDEILYARHINRYTYIHLKDTIIESRDSFTTIMNSLQSAPYFHQCTRGIIINFNSVKKIQQDVFIMSDESYQPISRRNKRRILNLFRDFLENANEIS